MGAENPAIDAKPSRACLENDGAIVIPQIRTPLWCDRRLVLDVWIRQQQFRVHRRRRWAETSLERKLISGVILSYLRTIMKVRSALRFGATGIPLAFTWLKMSAEQSLTGRTFAWMTTGMYIGMYITNCVDHTIVLYKPTNEPKDESQRSRGGGSVVSPSNGCIGEPARKGFQSDQPTGLLGCDEHPYSTVNCPTS